MGTVGYFYLGWNAPYFQLVQAGVAPAEARSQAAVTCQELFPAGSLKQSLQVSARVWRTWALVVVYFTTFGGFAIPPVLGFAVRDLGEAGYGGDGGRWRGGAVVGRRRAPRRRASLRSVRRTPHVASRPFAR